MDVHFDCAKPQPNFGYSNYANTPLNPTLGFWGSAKNCVMTNFVPTNG
jgi:hypothetical protein